MKAAPIFFWHAEYNRYKTSAPPSKGGRQSLSNEDDVTPLSSSLAIKVMMQKAPWRHNRFFEIVQLSVMPQRRHAGFTLLELLVVMVIIGLLASYVGPRFFDQIGKSEVKATRAQLDAFGKALDAYRLDTGHYPSTEHGLNALIEAPANEVKWAGPYLQKKVPPDPWGHVYQYKAPGDSKRDYDLMSLGKDGQRGGTGDAADITSWEMGR